MKEPTTTLSYLFKKIKEILEYLNEKDEIIIKCNRNTIRGGYIDDYYSFDIEINILKKVNDTDSDYIKIRIKTRLSYYIKKNNCFEETLPYIEFVIAIEKYVSYCLKSYTFCEFKYDLHNKKAYYEERKGDEIIKFDGFGLNTLPSVLRIILALGYLVIDNIKKLNNPFYSVCCKKGDYKKEGYVSIYNNLVKVDRSEFTQKRTHPNLITLGFVYMLKLCPEHPITKKINNALIKFMEKLIKEVRLKYAYVYPNLSLQYFKYYLL